MGKGTLRWYGLESLLNPLIYGTVHSRRDKFNKEIKERGTIIKSMNVEARGPKKGRSQKSHEQVSFQENHSCVAQSQKFTMRKTKLGPKRGDKGIVRAGHQEGAAPGKL